MKYFVCVYIFFALGCSTTKEYKLYRRDSTINYPKEELTLKLVSDSTGVLTNSEKDRETLNQKFSFTKANKFLVIQNVFPSSEDLIALKRGDTIMVHKNRLHFFYNGDKKYLLSFRKKIKTDISNP